MSEDWQFCFLVKGLVAPKDEINFDNLLIIGFPPSDNAGIFFKERVETKAEKSNVKDKLMNKLMGILQLYGLITDKHVEVMPSSSYGKIESERPFGSKELCKHLGFLAIYRDEDRKDNIINIKKAISKYETVGNIFSRKSKGFLRNAIDYYNRSLGDNRYEEKLIDLMISLESLFSNETDELGLRYSLRVAFLLSAEEEEKRPKIFKNIHSLYGKRSKVVHGTEKVKIEYSDISFLQDCVKEAIKRIIHIDLSKQVFLELLDESVYNTKKASELTEIVNEAIAKW